MSFKYDVLMIGGSGFIGKKIAAKLEARGYRVCIPTRRLKDAKELSVLPKVYLVEADIHQDMDLDRLFGGLNQSGIVINLVGILHDKMGSPYGPGFKKNHVELTNRLIQKMKSLGIRRYLHMSALGADENGPSMYQRSKGAAERLVQQSSLDWTIFRPSVVFGQDDNFINMFAKLQKIAPVLPLGGASAKFQPVYVEDVARAFVDSLALSQTVRQIYDLVGPKVYTLKELVNLAGLKAQRQAVIIPLPSPLAYLQAWALEIMPGPTLMSRDNVASMLVDNVSDKNSLTEVFQIKPTPLESILS
ncbi:MAG: complex I NDUFA9 subunit family protein [Burkholderiaceae bacterium]|jgi:NADH dehydrogenase|nr:complex I NDUFA9 subunit family protein [Burkholderiaceae bacterium]